MKRNTLILIAVVVLAAIGIYFGTKTNPKSTTELLKESYAFAVEDTASITRIVMTDKTPASVELIKENNQWLVNGEDLARNDAMEILMETLYRMEMRNFIQENAKKAINQRIDIFGTEVKVYSGESLIKHFFVGTETDDQLGTHMRLADYEDPYAVHILGFNGYLNTRFFTSASMWKDRTIWGFDNIDISKISVEYPSRTDLSFQLEVINGVAQLKNGSDEPVDVSQEHLSHLVPPFLAAFRSTKYEGAIIPSDAIFSRKDSLLNTTPYAVITAWNKKGEKQELSTYRIKAAEDTYDDQGLPAQFDPDRMHAFINKDRFVLVQFYGLKQVLLTLNDFVGNP